MSSHPPEPRIVHPLPPAPHFVGREAELEALRELWRSGFRGVAALVGLGGAGKTAVAAHFLDSLPRSANLPRPDGQLVWSFYQEPDAGLFLKEAYAYFARGQMSATPARGAGLLHLLREALAEGGPHLLVLDGLERVQQQADTETFGQVEDPLLRGLLTRVAEGGNALVLVTSRFPLTDLRVSEGHGYRHIDIGGLRPDAAVTLLRAHGVHGDDDRLGRLVEQYGAHALTLDHLGSLLGHFLGGDPERAPELPTVPTPAGDRQALRLARLLQAYEEHLPEAELALLCRLCLLRRSVTEEQVLDLFLCTPAVHARTVRELAELVRRAFEPSTFTGVGLDDLAEAVRGAAEEMLCSAPIAGPEESFRRELHRLPEVVAEVTERDADTVAGDLVGQYGRAALDQPTPHLPLPKADRDLLFLLYARFRELCEHPLLASRHVDPVLKHAMTNVGYRPIPFDEVAAADLRQAFRSVLQQLGFLVSKHFGLRHVREVCAAFQRKWTLAGPLAPLDVQGLTAVLASLVGRHLVLREADGSYSVHPAVRDHLSPVGKVPDAESWHELIRSHLLSLVQRPGKRLPEDAATLELVEEAIHHARKAGRQEEAERLYNHLLGGVRHLLWKLGEAARGLRILREFDPCPAWELGWYFRAAGELEAAYRLNDLPYFRADIRLLQGRLPEVAAEDEPSRTAIAAFLMGETKRVPPQPLGCPVLRDQILVYLGQLTQVQQSELFEGFYRDIGWEGDRARCQLVRADVARRLNDPVLCRQLLNEASRWILHSGSVDHLCLLHLIRARAARADDDLKAARRAVDEGLHTARQSGLGLYRIELLSEQAEILLAQRDPAAENPGREARRLAAAPECRFLWGVAAADHLVGQSLVLQERRVEARAVLEAALSLRRRLGDPGAVQTERLLARLVEV